MPKPTDVDAGTATSSAAALAFWLAILISTVAKSDDKAPGDTPGSRFPVLSGIGAALRITDEGPQIGILTPGSVAERCGKIHVGDRIVSIRTGDTAIKLKGKKMGEVVSLIRGPVGTTITLEIMPESSRSSVLVSLKREAVPIGGPSTYDNIIGKVPAAVQFSHLGQSSTTTLSNYSGQVVVLDFWASWCGTCYATVDKMQEIARAHPEWRNRVAFLTATIDTDPKAASGVIKNRRWKETIHLSLPAEKLESMSIQTVPTVLILSPDGKIAAAGDPHSVAIEDEVLKLLVSAGTEHREK